MAATAIDYYSDQATYLQNLRGDVLQQHDDIGKLYVYHFRFDNGTGSTIAADSVIELGKVGQGLILPTSKIICEDLGTSTTLDIGFDEYYKDDGTLVAADPDVLIDGADVSTAAINTDFHSIGTSSIKNAGFLLEGWAKLLVMPRVSTWAAGAELNVYLHVIHGK